ncbi:MAG: alanine dehydrogenase [Flavobacteriales bacterium]|nr:alanine dehydrogenase [Flavobacteriales bacterium]
MKIGIIREGKTPPDKRVPFTPYHCAEIKEKYNHVEVFVQPSDIRAYKDSAYASQGIELKEDLSDCDVLFGVKEVLTEMLIPKKKYFFFSHTYKEQSYNRDLLRAILDKKIQLIDYEMLKDKDGNRIIGFGRYAGIVGAYNGLRALGELHSSFTLKPAHACDDRMEMESYLSQVKLPKNFKLIMTGMGRVGRGAREIIDNLDIQEVSTHEYLTGSFDGPVFCHIDAEDYNKRKDGSEFDKSHFYADPQEYDSDFFRFAEQSDMYIACHYWDHNAPQILTRGQLADSRNRIKLISDISCDIGEPIASTIRPSTIEEPFYGYDPVMNSEVPFGAEGSISVQAVDNLPCELPKDASEHFGRALIDRVLPHLLGDDEDGVIARASESDLEGNLTEDFAYLKDYVAGTDVPADNA